MVEKDSPSQPEGWRRRWWWWGGEGSEGRGTSPGNPPTTTRPIILPPGRRIAAPAQHARRGELPIRILRLLKMMIFSGEGAVAKQRFFFSKSKIFRRQKQTDAKRARAHQDDDETREREREVRRHGQERDEAEGSAEEFLGSGGEGIFFPTRRCRRAGRAVPGPASFAAPPGRAEYLR